MEFCICIFVFFFSRSSSNTVQVSARSKLDLFLSILETFTLVIGFEASVNHQRDLKFYLKYDTQIPKNTHVSA